VVVGGWGSCKVWRGGRTSEGLGSAQINAKVIKNKNIKANNCLLSSGDRIRTNIESPAFGHY
jgi:hypothetical protein